MKKQLKQQPQKSRLFLEELEACQLFSGGIEGLIDSTLAVSTTVTYLDAETYNEQTSTVGASVSAAEQQIHEIVFIDTGVENYQTLVDVLLNNSDRSRNIEVVLLNIDENGIDVTSSTLQDRDDLDAIHIISHGDDGSVRIGNTYLNAESLAKNKLAIALWSNTFDEAGDILIYGCNLAASEVGESLINNLSDITLTDVAASDELTGSTMLGDYWGLEYNAGTIKSTVAISAELQQQWGSVLAETIYQSYTTVNESLEIKSDTPWGQTFSHTSGSATYSVNQIRLQLIKGEMPLRKISQ